MLKNPAKAIKFYSDTHDCTFNLIVHFAERLAGQTDGL
jgi:hypothetical protein